MISIIHEIKEKDFILFNNLISIILNFKACNRMDLIKDLYDDWFYSILTYSLVYNIFISS